MVKFVSQINARADDVYSWHQTFGASERLTPPWVNKELLRQEHIDDQTIQFMKTDSGILLEKTKSNKEKRSIISERIKSEQQKMYHIKNFDKLENKTLIKETISVNMFSSILPEFIINSIIERRLEREFNFRQKRIERDIRQHQKFADQGRKNIAILGADSIMAKQFKPFFTSGNHKVFSFVKRKPYPTAREIQLNTTNNNVGLASLKQINSILYFALDSKTKLTEHNFDKILHSKIRELRLLIRSFEINKAFPESFIMMSNTCVYKPLKANITEFTPTSSDSKIAYFYLTLEKELARLREHGVRVVYARTGNILSAKAGILKDELVKQRYAMCRQSMDESKYINWTSVDDAIYATHHIMFDQAIFGAVNICSSMALNANDLSLLLAQKTRRPFLFSLPEFIFKRFCGNIMSEKVLQSNAVYPQKLKQAGFQFSLENIDDALNWETGNFEQQSFSNY